MNYLRKVVGNRAWDKGKSMRGVEVKEQNKPRYGLESK